MRYLDLFAGAGGLSEGFFKAGFKPVAHVELCESACYTLKTRTAFHYLEETKNLKPYIKYTSGRISRDDLYSLIPKERLNSVICEEIGTETLKKIFSKIDALKGSEGIDLIVGGPPCQAYSLVGRSRDPNNMLNDKRNYLFKFYVKFLERYKPTYFVFENVLGLLSAKDEKGCRYLDIMTADFNKAGYAIDLKILNATDYGVLQNRKRIIIVGKRTDAKEFNFVWPLENPSNVQVSEAFIDLPAINAGEGDVFNCQLTRVPQNSWLYASGIRSRVNNMPVTYHCSRNHKKQDLEIYRIAVKKWNKCKERLKYSDLPERLKTHKNQKTFLDRFKVVAANESASQTIVAHIAKDGHYYIHPDINQNRSLTPREAARLQTFPDEYYFESVSGKPSRTDAYRQIGNAVPVRLAYAIAEQLREVWNE